MSKHEKRDKLNLLLPGEVADLMPRRPVLSSHDDHWHRPTLQKYNLSSCEFTIPPTRDHRIAIQLDGVALIESCFEPTRRNRCWSESGHFSVMPAESPVSWVIKGRPEALLLHLPPELVGQVGAELYERDPARVGLEQVFAGRDDTVERLGRVLLNEAENGGQETGLVVDTVSRALIAKLLARFSTGSSHLQLARSPALVGRQLRSVLEYIHADLGRTLSLTQLAAVSGISPSHFARAFRGAVGMPPHQYVIRLRVELACRLLRQTALTIVEISLQCGYDQPSHFATTFRKHTGISPSAYRRNCDN